MGTTRQSWLEGAGNDLLQLKMYRLRQIAKRREE
jgi:hypothetical protein